MAFALGYRRKSLQRKGLRRAGRGPRCKPLHHNRLRPCLICMHTSPRMCAERVVEGAWTLDLRNHNPTLYRLSYNHHSEADRIWTGNHRIDNPVLCQLSYGPKWRWRDSNPRPRLCACTPYSESKPNHPRPNSGIFKSARCLYFFIRACRSSGVSFGNSTCCSLNSLVR